MINAEEARKLTTQNLKGPAIEPLLEHVSRLVQKACNEGKRSIVNPLTGLRMIITLDQREAVWQKLREIGYTVTHHPDPDPGHPASHSYTEVSW